MKDLVVLLNGRSLDDIVIVDNKIESYASHLENGIPITDYLGQDEDEILEILERYLIKLQDAGDVRQLILKDFYLENISEMRRQQEIEEAIKQAELEAKKLAAGVPEGDPDGL